MQHYKFVSVFFFRRVNTLPWVKNYLFLKNFVTSEGAFSHNVLTALHCSLPSKFFMPTVILSNYQYCPVPLKYSGLVIWCQDVQMPHTSNLTGKQFQKISSQQNITINTSINNQHFSCLIHNLFGKIYVLLCSPSIPFAYSAVFGASSCLARQSLYPTATISVMFPVPNHSNECQYLFCEKRNQTISPHGLGLVTLSWIGD